MAFLGRLQQNLEVGGQPGLVQLAVYHSSTTHELH